MPLHTQCQLCRKPTQVHSKVWEHIYISPLRYASVKQVSLAYPCVMELEDALASHHAYNFLDALCLANEHPGDGGRHADDVADDHRRSENLYNNKNSVFLVCRK